MLERGEKILKIFGGSGRAQMRQWRKGKLTLVLAAIASVAGFASSAQAGITVTLDPGSPTGTGPYGYSYTVSIPAGDEIVTGNFFRIYDFSGLSDPSNGPAGWTLSIASSNPTPPPNVLLSHGDDPAISNLTFTYTGTVPLIGPLVIPGFSEASFDKNTTIKDFVGRDSVAIGPTAGLFVDSVGPVVVPAPVPEPATLGLLGVGATLILARRRR